MGLLKNVIFNKCMFLIDVFFATCVHMEQYFTQRRFGKSKLVVNPDRPKPIKRYRVSKKHFPQQ